MKRVAVLLLLTILLTGCSGGMEKPVLEYTIPVVTAEILEQTDLIEDSSPVKPTDGVFLLDLNQDGIEEKLVYKDGALTEILSVDAEGEKSLLQGYAVFLCDDEMTIAQFSEGSGGHTIYFYRMVDGEMAPCECLVYLWNDDRYCRSTDFSDSYASLVDISEEEYRNALAMYPSEEAKNSGLGHLFG